MIALLATFVSLAHAHTLAGVSMPETASVGGQAVVLNGMGLREKFFLDVFVGGLYLPERTTSGDHAIGQDVPKRLVMHFTFPQIPPEQIAGAFEEMLARHPEATAVRSNLTTLSTWFETAYAGDEIVLDYQPGVGTTVTVKGQVKGLIPGKDFMDAVLDMYVGPDPATPTLKNGLLGLDRFAQR